MTGDLLLELVLIIHAGIVFFNISAFIAIFAGRWLHWQWTVNRLFRFTHIFLLGIVALQAMLGRLCPLTILEFKIRQAAGEEVVAESFIVRTVESLIYYDIPLWVFAIVYCMAFLLALWLLRIWPVEKRRKHIEKEEKV